MNKENLHLMTRTDQQPNTVNEEHLKFCLKNEEKYF